MAGSLKNERIRRQAECYSGTGNWRNPVPPGPHLRTASGRSRELFEELFRVVAMGRIQAAPAARRASSQASRLDASGTSIIRIGPPGRTTRSISRRTAEA